MLMIPFLKYYNLLDEQIFQVCLKNIKKHNFSRCPVQQSIFFSFYVINYYLLQ